MLKGKKFDASALQRDLMVIVPRPRYTCTPTEVHMYPDQGTHVLRPRYAYAATEMRRPVSTNNLSSTIKKRHSSSKLCLYLFCTELSQVHNILAKVQFLKRASFYI